MNEIPVVEAVEHDDHYYVIGEQVRVGRSRTVWQITSFFGPEFSHAALQRPDLPTSNSSAHVSRLVPVV
ncbi:hypothetical protein HMPREF0063_11934 [Aeromicrobium marinum DSM 15272]|uniref:Uncharacterized protein n=1 Tax=Aeromicrobium marinum DSM 15272 TaxID=585531 RepID=E2SDZ8_9ACTN|nr:hypothetical protein [Aeromicrobium marinum]EFQ82725.1 hypothetical protein HMPREF0063_11934 [Aeromicrobium marinum DSM 15272]